MVVTFYIPFYTQCGQIANQRHKGLKTTEEKGHSQQMFCFGLFTNRPGDDRNSEGIRCKSKRYYYNCDKNRNSHTNSLVGLYYAGAGEVFCYFLSRLNNKKILFTPVAIE